MTRRCRFWGQVGHYAQDCDAAWATAQRRLLVALLPTVCSSLLFVKSLTYNEKRLLTYPFSTVGSPYPVTLIINTPSLSYVRRR